jgi:predicted transcriptional regulator YdeE
MITKIEETELPGFYAAGVTVRTINQNGQSKKDMMALWNRFMAGNLLQQISDRVSDDIYCFYTNYQSDHTDYYTALLGCKVNSLANIGEGFSGLSIPAGKYQVYSLAGDPLHSMLDAWQEIWDSGVVRAYTFDFDLYAVNAKNFEESEVKIYLAVK